MKSRNTTHASSCLSTLNYVVDSNGYEEDLIKYDVLRDYALTAGLSTKAGKEFYQYRLWIEKAFEDSDKDGGRDIVSHLRNHIDRLRDSLKCSNIEHCKTELTSEEEDFIDYAINNDSVSISELSNIMCSNDKDANFYESRIKRYIYSNYQSYVNANNEFIFDKNLRVNDILPEDALRIFEENKEKSEQANNKYKLQ